MQPGIEAAAHGLAWALAAKLARVRRDGLTHVSAQSSNMLLLPPKGFRQTTCGSFNLRPIAPATFRQRPITRRDLFPVPIPAVLSFRPSLARARTEEPQCIPPRAVQIQTYFVWPEKGRATP